MYRRRSYSRAPARKRGRRSYRRVRAPGASRTKLRAVANLRTGGGFGQELKSFESGQSAITVPATFTSLAADCWAQGSTAAVADTYWLNAPGVGSDATQRDGRIIRNHSIDVIGRVRFYIDDVADTNILPTLCIALVLDTQANGITPSASGPLVYQNRVKITPFPGAEDTTMRAYPTRVLENGPRFRVLAFHRRVCPPTAVHHDETGNVNDLEYEGSFRIFRKLGFKTHFKTDSSVPAADALIDNGIFLMAWTNLATQAHMAWTSRLRFTG